MAKRDTKAILLPAQVLRVNLARVFATARQVARGLSKCSGEEAFIGALLQEPLVDLQVEWPRQSPSAIVNISLVQREAWLAGQSWFERVDITIFYLPLHADARRSQF